jgi:hypothetical protein
VGRLSLGEVAFSDDILSPPTVVGMFLCRRFAKGCSY